MQDANMRAIWVVMPDAVPMVQTVLHAFAADLVEHDLQQPPWYKLDQTDHAHAFPMSKE